MYSRTLSVEQAFNFNRTRQEAFGYLTLAEVLATDPLRGSGDWNFGPAAGDDLPVDFHSAVQVPA